LRRFTPGSPTTLEEATMTVFSRKFPIECLSDAVLKENEWFRQLLRLWHPAGDANNGPAGNAEGALVRDAGNRGKIEHLRVAFRSGYMNFYCGGQSIAKVQCVGERLQAKIHEKYVFGFERNGERYATLSSAGFQEPGKAKTE